MVKINTFIAIAVIFIYFYLFYLLFNPDFKFVRPRCVFYYFGHRGATDWDKVVSFFMRN